MPSEWPAKIDAMLNRHHAVSFIAGMNTLNQLDWLAVAQNSSILVDPRTKARDKHSLYSPQSDEIGYRAKGESLSFLWASVEGELLIRRQRICH